jgi:hypothetical protein
MQSASNNIVVESATLERLRELKSLEAIPEIQFQ